MNDTTDSTDTTDLHIPTFDIAVQTVLAQREADMQEAAKAQEAAERELFELRSLLLGTVMLKIKELMENLHVNDVEVLQRVILVLDGMDLTPPLSDEEQELVNAFRNGRVTKTDKGAYRDSEWYDRMVRPTKDASEAEPTPVVKPEPTPEPKKEEPTESAPVADPTTSDEDAEPTPEPTPVVKPEPKVKKVEPKDTPTQKKADPAPVAAVEPTTSATTDPVTVARTAMNDDEASSLAASAADEGSKPAKVIPPLAAPAADDSNTGHWWDKLTRREPKTEY